MCGRFVRHSSVRLIERTFNIDSVEAELASSYNVAPSQEILAVINNGANRLVTFHWGLVPFWAKDRNIGNRLINARTETVAEKPSFRTAFKKRRCLIVADGFYEWKGEKGSKQPWFLTTPSAEPFAFAGLWESWTDEKNSDYLSTTIITTAASDSVNNIHHRMPVILQPNAYSDWLNKDLEDPVRLKQIMKVSRVLNLRSYPVSKQVNAVANNHPGCIEPAKTQD
jgi:putative SOS response-associated peptidase YedK